jgi:protein TonB
VQELPVNTPLAYGWATYLRGLVNHLLCILLFFFLVVNANAQERVPTTVHHRDSIFKEVDISPVFPGGMDSLLSYLKRESVFPEEAKEKGEFGVVVLEFVVAQDGGIANAKVITSVSPSLDAEALRVCTRMPPWAPGMKNGKPVSVLVRLPFVFLIDSKEPAKRGRIRK